MVDTCPLSCLTTVVISCSRLTVCWHLCKPKLRTGSPGGRLPGLGTFTSVYSSRRISRLNVEGEPRAQTDSATAREGVQTNALERVRTDFSRDRERVQPDVLGAQGRVQTDLVERRGRQQIDGVEGHGRLQTGTLYGRTAGSSMRSSGPIYLKRADTSLGFKTGTSGRTSWGTYQGSRYQRSQSGSHMNWNVRLSFINKVLPSLKSSKSGRALLLVKSRPLHTAFSMKPPLCAYRCQWHGAPAFAATAAAYHV